MQSWFPIEFNGETWRLEGVAVSVVLLDALKERGAIDPLARMDRGQGGVLVVVEDGTQDQLPVFRAIDCGLVPLVTMANRRIWTVDGLKEAFPDHPLWEVGKRYPGMETHPVRRDNLLALLFGWCSIPLERREEQLPEGFISRTADYAGVRRMVGELRKVIYEVPAILSERFEELEEVQYVDDAKNRYYRPQTIVELFEWKRQAADARLVAGALGDCSKKRVIESRSTAMTTISVEGISELRMLLDEESQWEIGSAAPLSLVAEVLGDEYSGLRKVLKCYESTPVRNRATLGGQLNSSEGRRELGPMLLALDARVQLASAEGARDVTLDSFYGTGDNTTLRPNEIIKSVTLPRNTSQMLQARGCETRLYDGYRVACRRTLCPAILTAAFAIEVDGSGTITRALLSFGGIASRPLVAPQTAVNLKGKEWNQETMIGILKPLEEEMVSIGGLESDDERRQMVATLLQKFFHQHPREKDVNARQLGAIADRIAEQFPDD